MSTLLAIGDSVVWGQGLAAEHKTATIVARSLGAHLEMRAHAGAKIGIRDSYTVAMPSGEVPCFFPTILQQLYAYTGNGGPSASHGTSSSSRMHTAIHSSASPATSSSSRMHAATSSSAHTITNPSPSGPTSSRSRMHPATDSRAHTPANPRVHDPAGSSVHAASGSGASTGGGEDHSLVAGHGEDHSLVAGHGEDHSFIAGRGEDHSLVAGHGEDHSLLAGRGGVEASQVNWVLMNGGINDVEIQRVFNPMVPQYELELHTRNYCGRDMLMLLRKVTQRFQHAVVLVLGYYPGLSHQSRREGVELLYSLVHGVRFAPVCEADLFRDGVVEHCLRFWRLSNGLLRGAVEHVNREAGRTRAIFVDSGMTEANAAYAPQSLLWELDVDDPERAPDETAMERRAASEQVAAGPLQARQCLLSSAGHPNRAGAARMAQRCLEALAGAERSNIASV